MRESTDFERVPCLLCGQDDAKLIARTGQFSLPTYVSICPRDGLVYLNPRWSRVRYQAFYEQEYDEYYGRTSAVPDDRKYRGIKEIIGRLRRAGPASFEAVLDVGAGMGWSLDFYRREVNEAARLAAVEPSARCAEHLRSLGVEVIARDVDTDWHKEHAGAFDLVIMRHALEHFLDPVAVLRKVRHVLTPQGALYLAVPDMMNPKGSLTRYWFRVVHTYYFSEATLRQTVQRAGLRFETIGAEHSELWGLLRPADHSAAYSLEDFPGEAVYQRQRRLIASYRRRQRLKRLLLPPRLTTLVPERAKRKVKAALPTALKDRLNLK